MYQNYKGKRMQHGFKLAIVVALLILVSSRAKASENGYAAILYDSKNGLPTSEANAVVQTADGFIWIGGYGGLVRYDGNKFYNLNATTGISSVGCLFVDSKDRLWVGTNDKGIALYQDGNFLFLGKKEGMESASIKKVIEDENGNIVIATTSGISYIDTSLQVHMLKDSHLNNQYICDIAGSQEGTIVAITLDGALAVLRNLQVTDYYGASDIPFEKPRSVNFDSQKMNTIYLGTEESNLVKIDLDKGFGQHKTISVEPLYSINKAVRTPNGALWICADNGMGYLDTDESFHLFDETAMNNSIDEMMVDYEGNLWFASSRQGVMKIAENRFFNISLAAGLPEMVVNTTCKYQGNLYVGSDSGLFVLDDAYQAVENELTDRLKGIRIRCILNDSKNNLWLCTYGDNGLLKYEPNGNIVSFNQDNGLNSNRVRSIIAATNGDMIVSSSGGVNVIRNDQIIQSYGATEGLANTEILTVCEGENGTIYAGSDGDGIYLIDNGNIRAIDSLNGLESDVILRIKKSPNLRGYWIITGNSIAYMEDEDVKTLHTFPYSNNFDMFFAKNGDVWVLSGNGIYVVNEEALESGSELTYTYYFINDGMPSSATANSRSYIDTNGNLYVAGSANVFHTNINEMQNTMNTVKLSVPYIEADGKRIYMKKGQNVVIPSECKRLTIYGYALTYGLQNPKIKYFLNGFDEEKLETTKAELTSISYTNLDGGDYDFVLEVYNPDGTINNSQTIVIEKTKTFWESAWFIVVIIVVVLSALLLIAFVTTKIRNQILIIKQKRAKMLIKQVISAFAKIIDGKDKYTNGHSFRVADYASQIATEMGYDSEQIEGIKNIALLHDIGKTAIPDAILNKTEQLSEEEYLQMKNHTTQGYEILSEISAFPEICMGARYHHEKIDGSGYPLGLKGEEIPDIAKIITVADTFDAMYSTRPYRKKLSLEYVADELERVAGTQLDEKAVAVMVKLIREGKIASDGVE